MSSTLHILWTKAEVMAEGAEVDNYRLDPGGRGGIQRLGELTGVFPNDVIGKLARVDVKADCRVTFTKDF